MQELINNHGRRHEVRCLSHAGHVMPWKNDNRDFTLQEQIDQKAFYIKQRLSEDPTLRLVVIGYPIGSYITLDVANRFPSLNLKVVLQAMYTLHCF
ncbi:Lipid-droplet associated hydrolase [Phytophthora infestans]|uniref:Lipid-droplet associated hydrolase n=1 Tax=Phytophthora infestans TaxID=4787 RepID=A0A833RNY4_PHYIN|nr:Lipid-droplet associated hydrolase [Phytophthora infestans]